MKKTDAIVARIEEPVFRNVAICQLGGDYKDAQSEAKLAFGQWDLDRETTADARFECLVDGKRFLFWFRDKKPQKSLVAHEALHAAVQTLRESGVPLCDQVEEVLAYLVGFWVRAILQKED